MFPKQSWTRTAAMMAVVPYLPKVAQVDIIQEALVTARGTSDEQNQSDLLMVITYHLPEEMQNRAHQ